MVKGMQHDANSKKEGSNARVFSGKQEEYFEWRRFFLHWIHKMNLPVKYKCHYLTYFVKKGKDPALDQIVFDKTPDEVSYERIIISLEEYYGGETKAVDLALSKLLKTPRIRLEKYHTILNAWAVVNEFVNFCRDNRMEFYLYRESLMPKKVFNAIASPEVIRAMNHDALIRPHEYIDRPKLSIYRLQTYLHHLQASERDTREAISFKQDTHSSDHKKSSQRPITMAITDDFHHDSEINSDEDVDTGEANAFPIKIEVPYLNEDMVPENVSFASFMASGFTMPPCDCCGDGHHLLYQCPKYQEWKVPNRESCGFLHQPYLLI